MMGLTFHDKKEVFSIQTNKAEGEWQAQMLFQIAVTQPKTYSYQDVKNDFEQHLPNFELFWYSKPLQTLRSFGLLVL